MRRIIVVGLIILLCTSTYASVMAVKDIYLEVFKPDYTVVVDGKELNDNTTYPLLEYNGNTYIALRDYANLWGGSVRWDEELQVPFLSAKGYYPYHRGGDFLFDDIESAREVGKALVEEKFASRISEKTKYSVMEIGLSGAFAYYSIYIYLDGSDLTEKDLDDKDLGYALENADIEIRYFIQSGETYFLERQGDRWEKLFVGESL